MLFTMSEVVLKVIAFGLECVVVLILDLPSSASRLGYFGDIVLIDCVGSGPCIAINHFAILVGRDEFKPVDQQRIVAIGQRQVAGITIRIREIFFSHSSA